ncbi:hypothetical protein NL676_016570 [Syzygium grande]|nr:hypothetical protein NL676_016570 [Syzygium grande]
MLNSKPPSIGRDQRERESLTMEHGAASSIEGDEKRVRTRPSETNEPHGVNGATVNGAPLRNATTDWGSTATGEQTPG